MWWELRFEKPPSEEEMLLLFDLGVAGTAESLDTGGSPMVSCYLHVSSERLKEILAELASRNIEPSQWVAVKSKDWVSRCDELRTPVTIHRVTILPVLEHRPLDGCHMENEIFIIPGTGFGTGHHASTRLAIELLQHPAIRASSLHTTLDFGTGSGILALAAAKLYGTRCNAIDVDPLALENAKENIMLNEMMHHIEVQLTNGVELKGPYDLIMANIYAEVLCGLYEKFGGLLAGNGHLILSGITADQSTMVEHSFSASSQYSILHRLEESGWCAYLLRRE